MGLKSVVLVTILVLAAAIAVPMAQAQLGGLGGGLGGLVSGVLGPLLGLIRVQGVIFCTPNGNIGANGATTPVFPNALVQLQCGGTVVSSTTTNGLGAFSILLDPLSFAQSLLLNGCNVVVNTPLATCNASLPSIGRLDSTLQLVGNTISGLLTVVNIIPRGFNLT